MGVVLAILLFSLLIFFHELGHFVAAKKFGVQVNEFALFMGPAIFKKKVGDTLYSLRCIPIGGYCAMEGEDEDTDNPASFQKAAWWKRLIILVAGAAMNFLIGLLLMTIVAMPMKNVITPEVSYLEPDCSLVAGGLEIGDEILKIDGERLYTQSDFSMLLAMNPAEKHDLVVLRDGKKIELNDVLFKAKVFESDVEKAIEENRKAGKPDPEKVEVAPRYGITFTVEELTFFGKLRYAWFDTIDCVRTVRLSLQMLLTGKASLNDVMGPVGVGSVMVDITKSSPDFLNTLFNMLWFGGFISVNLAVMNMLPIPALDGGRAFGLVVVTLIEKITRKKVNPKVEAYIHGAGLIILLIFTGIVMFKDIFKIIKG